jgi:hypothetical protein
MGVLAMFRTSLTQVDLLWELVRLESLSDTWDELATIQNIAMQQQLTHQEWPGNKQALISTCITTPITSV